MTETNPIYEYTDEQAKVAEAYRQMKTAMLCSLYWSTKCDRAKAWLTGLQVVSAAASSATLVGVLQQTWPPAVLAISAAAAITGAVIPVLGLAENAAKFDRLAYAYNALSARFEEWRVRLRQAGRLTPELEGEARMLNAESCQIAHLEAGAVDAALQKKFTAAVERQIPPDTLWLPR